MRKRIWKEQAGCKSCRSSTGHGGVSGQVGIRGRWVSGDGWMSRFKVPAEGDTEAENVLLTPH